MLNSANYQPSTTIAPIAPIANPTSTTPSKTPVRAVIGLIAITVIGAAIWHRRTRYTSTPRSAH